jgi:hypothetical protein
MHDIINFAPYSEKVARMYVANVCVNALYNKLYAITILCNRHVSNNHQKLSRGH